MRKWNELSKKEKTMVIAKGAAVAVVGAAGVIVGVNIGKKLGAFDVERDWKDIYEQVATKYPNTQSRFVQRESDKYPLALQLWYTIPDTNKNVFMAESAFANVEGVHDYADWIMRMANEVEVKED